MNEITNDFSNLKLSKNISNFLCKLIEKFSEKATNSYQKNIRQ